MSEMLNKLRTHLASITPEQFKEEWNEIEKMNLTRPTVEDFLTTQDKYNTEELKKFNTNSEVGSHHWFQTLVGQCIRIAEFIEKNPNDKRIQDFEYGKKIKETLVFVGKNFKSINSLK